MGIVFWTFFTEATNQGLASIVRQADLIRKINFPKYIIVISGSLSAFINLLINLVIIAVFLVINGVHLHFSALLFPLYIIELYILALSVAFILSAVYVKYRDISHIWEILLQAAFYATPILYPVTLVMKQAGSFVAQLLLINPAAQIVQDARHALITTQSVTMNSLTDNWLYILAPFAIILCLMLFAIYYFKKNSAYFSENV